MKRLNWLSHDLSIPGGDFLTHLDDTYEGAGEHDGLVIAVALAGWRVLPVGRRKSLPNGCHEGSLVFVKQGWGTWIIVEFNDCQGNVRVGSVRISRSGGGGGAHEVPPSRSRIYALTGRKWGAKVQVRSSRGSKHNRAR